MSHFLSVTWSKFVSRDATAFLVSDIVSDVASDLNNHESCCIPLSVRVLCGVKIVLTAAQLVTMLMFKY